MLQRSLVLSDVIGDMVTHVCFADKGAYVLLSKRAHTRAIATFAVLAPAFVSAPTRLICWHLSLHVLRHREQHMIQRLSLFEYVTSGDQLVLINSCKAPRCVRCS